MGLKAKVIRWINLDPGEYTVYSKDDKEFKTIPWDEPNFKCYAKDEYSVIIQRVF